MFRITRRRALAASLALAAAAGMSLSGMSVSGVPLSGISGAHATEARSGEAGWDALAAEAAAIGPVTWYESSPEEQIDQVVEAFNERFPDVRINYVRLVGGNSLASRAVQEMQGVGRTADVLIGGADHLWQLAERDYLERVDWQALGIPEKLTPNDFAVATTASVYVALWNTNKVADAEAPKTWDDILDPKWTGRIGHWVRAASFAQLASAWGEAEAEAKLRRFMALKPFLFASTFPLAQQVGAGEVDLAIGFYHTTQPPIAAGAPIKVAALDPTPMHTIYTGIGKNPANLPGAKLFVAWLVSPEGAVAYEKATARGNPLLEDTQTYKLLEGRDIVEWPPEQSDTLARVNERFNEILATVGEAR